MEEVIRLRKSLEDLTNEEFTKWVSLPKSREIITTALVDSFRVKLLSEKANESLLNLGQLNEEIGSILIARTDQQQPSTTPEATNCDLAANKENRDYSINSSPSEMIAYIASFLSLSELIKFELCSTKTLIGSRTANTITYTMTAEEFGKCMRFSNRNRVLYNWSPLKRVHDLSVSVKDVLNELYDCREHTLKPNQFLTLQHVAHLLETKKLRKLAITMTTDTDQGHDIISEILLSNSFDNLLSFGLKHYVHEASNFALQRHQIKLFDLMPELQFLSIRGIYHGDGYELNETPDRFRGFDGDLTSFRNDVSRLQHLHSLHTSLDCADELYLGPWETIGRIQAMIGDSANGMWFQKLQEICLTKNHHPHEFEDYESGIRMFLEKCALQNVQRIHLSMTKKADEFAAILQRMSDRLEYLGVECETDEDIVALLDVLHDYFEAQIQRRQRIKIRIVCNNLYRWKKGDCLRVDTNRLTRLLKTLSVQTVDFVLLICRVNIKEQSISNIIEWKKYDISQCNEDEFAISNPSCKINGYHEQWLMNCTNCNRYR